MSTHSIEGVSDSILHRAYSEFVEMPGLRLTVPQAQRLLGLDESTCRHLLEHLVNEKFLRCDHDVYRRLGDGFVGYMRVTIAGVR